VVAMAATAQPLATVDQHDHVMKITDWMGKRIGKSHTAETMTCVLYVSMFLRNIAWSSVDVHPAPNATGTHARAWKLPSLCRGAHAGNLEH
jgi:cobalamin biosynthesis protein CbiG